MVVAVVAYIVGFGQSCSLSAADDQTAQTPAMAQPAPQAAPPPWQQAPAAPSDAPNIVLILLDDVGFAASSSFGGPAETNFLHRLAADGLRYIRFHDTALCSPTRASLLSGRNHHRLGFGTVTEISNSYPGYNGFWPKSVASLPEILRRNGYSTAAFGKWHNTPLWEVSPVGPFDRWPTGLGFDYFYGFMQGEASQWEPPLYRNTTPVEPGKSPKDGYYLTTDLVNDASKWVGNHTALAPQKPYFLYFATGATHAPHHVPKAWIEKYKGKFDQGWDRLNADIFERQKKLGVIPQTAERSPRPAVLPAWDSLSADQKKLYSHQMEVYTAYLAATDFEVGRLVDSIRRGPKGDNTLVFYIVGDNGAAVEGGDDGSDENMAMYAGIPNDVAKQLARSSKLGGPDLDNVLAKGWAFALGTPFQGAKADATHFGGTRNPLVVSWPAQIKDVGAIRTQFAHVNDIAPTIYDILGIKFPDTVDGVVQAPIDGVSFAPSFYDANAPSQHHVQYFEIVGNRSIYQDGWLAGAAHHSSFANQAGKLGGYDEDRWELYNVDEDFSETHDLADRHPEKVKALKALFDSEARKNNVYPLTQSTMGGLFPGNTRPSLTEGRKDFVYPGTLPRIPVSAAPPLIGSYRLTAKLQVSASGASGVIMADGGRYGGYALYVKAGHLIFESNFFGDDRTIITSTASLPSGPVEVGYEYQRTDPQKWGGGVGRLFINGRNVGEGKVLHVGFAAPFDTFDIGADRGSPVSENYDAPFEFTGKVEQVHIVLQ